MLKGRDAIPRDLVEPHEVQQSQVQSPAHGLGNPKHKYRLDGGWIERPALRSRIWGC